MDTAMVIPYFSIGITLLISALAVMFIVVFHMRWQRFAHSERLLMSAVVLELPTCSTCHVKTRLTRLFVFIVFADGSPHPPMMYIHLNDEFLTRDPTSDFQKSRLNDGVNCAMHEFFVFVTEYLLLCLCVSAFLCIGVLVMKIGLLRPKSNVSTFHLAHTIPIERFRHQGRSFEKVTAQGAPKVRSLTNGCRCGSTR
ncbi:hypothetical protein QR680_015796 [Steinernema hermaphroditum]|uniref:Uncharacterized protein n=1 Tax=Steinernema hermaphroditum TaxID=289476 RepID=A0AA39HAV2_9BILA|nr:hypothetical protein QR680_015796 [Steinernema hermaphroditum]